jgi:hypothetical protein
VRDITSTHGGAIGRRCAPHGALKPDRPRVCLVPRPAPLTPHPNTPTPHPPGSINMKHIKTHYFSSHPTLNAYAIIPVGGEAWWAQPHGRGARFPAPAAAPAAAP